MLAVVRAPKRRRHLLRKWYLWWVASLRRPFRRKLGSRALSTWEIGEYGELLSVAYLRKHGRKVLYRNYSGPWGGEVDIVCRHGSTLVFTEVKTRTSTGRYRPADAVDAKKRKLIERGGRDWLRVLGSKGVGFRFDIVEVILIEGERPRLNVIERAFTIDRPGWMEKRE